MNQGIARSCCLKVVHGRGPLCRNASNQFVTTVIERRVAPATGGDHRKAPEPTERPERPDEEEAAGGAEGSAVDIPRTMSSVT